LRKCLGDTSLDQAMRMSIEDPETLDSQNLDCIVNHWKDKKQKTNKKTSHFRAIISKF